MNPEPPPTQTNSQVEQELKQLRQEISEFRSEIRSLLHPIKQTNPHRLTDHTGPRSLIYRARDHLMAMVPQNCITLPARVRSIATAGQLRQEWSPPRSRVWDLIAIVVVVVAAFLLRSVDLSGMPPGMHGDEAATGLEARRIIDTGWIGVYTGMAGGNPTGHYYLATIPLRLVDDPIVAVRLLSAVGGTLAVLALYILMRRNLGFTSAIIGSSLLAFSEWHIQFSRTGFVTGMWPTFVLLGMIALMEAIRSKAWYWWAVAGSLLASGTYIYNANGPLLIIIGVFIIWVLFGWSAVAICAAIAAVTLIPSPITIALLIACALFLFGKRYRDRRSLANVASFTAAVLAVLWELIRFIRDRPHEYFGRGEKLSVFKTEEWRSQDGMYDRASFLLHRYYDFWDRLTLNPRPNGVDLSGVTPLIPKMMLAICLVGLVVALVRRPTHLVLLSVAVVLAAPLTAVLTDMTVRRALVIVPFLAVLGAVGIVEILRLGLRHGKVTGLMAGALLLAVLAKSSYDNYTDFFDKTVDSGPVQHTFAVDLRDTAEYMQELPDDSYVYFYCERWVLEYDVLQLLAPDVRGENRLEKWGGDGTFTADRTLGRPVFIFMGNQVNELEQVQGMYPNGEVAVGPTYGAPLNGPAYVAYVLDDQPE